MVIGAGHLEPVCRAAAEQHAAVVLGVLERPADRGESVYAAAVSISPDGRIVAVQRKLMPTHEERLVWAIGDGHGLRTHPVGPFTVGALNCWENWMPLARSALQARGEDLHVAIWPGNPRNTTEITRFMALEGRSYVLSVSGLLGPGDLPENLPAPAAMEKAAAELPWARGGSCLAAPDGSWIIEPVVDQTGLFVAEIEHERVRRARHSFDPAGHYSRPDVFALRVDRRRQQIGRFKD